MSEPHTVALIVDPEYGERIRAVAAGVWHAWVVASDMNDAAVERIWRESPAIAAVRELPDDAWIYTNAADVVYLLTGRLLSIPIPIRRSPGPKRRGPPTMPRSRRS